MVNGAGLAMATMDILNHEGLEAANFLDLGGGADEQAIPACLPGATEKLLLHRQDAGSTVGHPGSRDEPLLVSGAPHFPIDVLDARAGGCPDGTTDALGTADRGVRGAMTGSRHRPACSSGCQQPSSKGRTLPTSHAFQFRTCCSSVRAVAALDTVDRSEFVYVARFTGGFVFERSLTVFKTGLVPTQLMPLWICCFTKLRRRAAIRAENFPFRIPGGLCGQIQLVQDRTRRRIARQLLRPARNPGTSFSHRHG